MKIPVGYQKVPCENIEIDDVIRNIGKVVDMWIEDELVEWETPYGRSYKMETFVVVTESVVEDEYLNWEFPLAAFLEVLQYRKVKEDLGSEKYQIFPPRTSGSEVILSYKG